MALCLGNSVQVRFSWRSSFYKTKLTINFSFILSQVCMERLLHGVHPYISPGLAWLAVALSRDL